MGLPSKQRTRTSKRDRASHFALKSRSTVQCETCKAPRLPHTACKNCGSYKGKKVMNIEKRAARRAKRVRKTS